MGPKPCQINSLAAAPPAKCAQPPRTRAWARLAHALAALKAVRNPTDDRTIVQRTQIRAELAEILKKLGVAAPKQLLALSEPAADPLAA